jgi:hypothetical protein
MPERTWHLATERVKWSTKYQKKHGIMTDQAVLPEGVAAQIQHTAKRVYRALDLNGYARIDFRMGMARSRAFDGTRNRLFPDHLEVAFRAAADDGGPGEPSAAALRRLRLVAPPPVHRCSVEFPFHFPPQTQIGLVDVSAAHGGLEVLRRAYILSVGRSPQSATVGRRRLNRTGGNRARQRISSLGLYFLPPPLKIGIRKVRMALPRGGNAVGMQDPAGLKKQEIGFVRTRGGRLGHGGLKNRF